MSREARDEARAVGHEPAGGVDPDMVSWIRTTVQASEVDVARRSAGASRAGYAVDARLRDGTTMALWLRADTGAGPQSNTVYTLEREAAVYRSLAGRGVRLAGLVAVHPSGDAFLMRRVEGENWFSSIDEPERQITIAVDFMRQLAALHAIDVRDLDLPELGPLRTTREHVAEELDIWEGQYRAQRDPDPTLEIALAWLRRNVDGLTNDRLALIQGDTGPGNFMFVGDSVSAVTDWEMAHFGDIHDDLAWIYVRDVQERFTNLLDRLRDYEHASGTTIDPVRLRYFLLLAQTRCAIGTRSGLLARDSRGEIGNHLIFSTLHQRLVAEALMTALGVDPIVEVDALPVADTAVTWVYDVALNDLRENVVPSIGDAFAAGRAKGIARLLKYLREHDRSGAAVVELERRGLERLLGQRVDCTAAGRAELCERIRADRVEDLAVVRHCILVERQRTEMLRPAMGALADRHHAPLPPSDASDNAGGSAR